MSLNLRLCGLSAAREAVGRWHYSRRYPPYTTERFGAYEAGRYVGCVLYGLGAAPELRTSFGLEPEQMRELTRFALAEHETATSRIGAISLRLLKRQSPKVRLVVSFADPGQGHLGVLYQAMGWVYLGRSEGSTERVMVGGRLRHPRSLVSIYGTRAMEWLRANVDADAKRVDVPAKYRYAIGLDAEMRDMLALRALPYPKCAGSIDSDVAAYQAVEGGASPTTALQSTLFDNEAA